MKKGGIFYFMGTLAQKQTVLVDGLDKAETKAHLAIYTSLRDGNYEGFDLAIRNYQYAAQQVGDLWKVARQVNDAKFKRVQRLRHHVSSIIKDGKAIYLTLTFNDDVLASTTPQTRRKYVSRYLKSSAEVYVANKDFGKEHEREHYHAIVSGRVDYSLWHSFGAIKGEKIRNTDKDLIRTAKYVAKLTFHAIKQTASFERIIYSR